MNFERQDIGLGLFVVGAGAAIVAGLLAVAGILKGETIDIHVMVDQFANMRVGTTVYIRGYRVGEIGHIEPMLEPTLQFDVTMSIDADFPLYEGTTAVIGSQGGFIGETVINLQVPEQPGRLLLDGDNIGRASTTDLTAIIARADSLAIKIEEVASQLVYLLSPEVAGLIAEEIRSTLATGRQSIKVLEGQFVALTDSLTAGIGIAVASLKTVAGMVEENRPRIASMLDSTLALMSNFKALAATTDSLLVTEGPAIGRNLAKMEAVLEELRILLADMNNYTLWQMMFKTRRPDTTASKL